MVKKLKAQPFDLRRLLVQASALQLSKALAHRGAGTADEVLDIFVDVAGWDEHLALPQRALIVLISMERTVDAVEAWADLVSEHCRSEGEVSFEEDAVRRIGIVIAGLAEPAVVGPLLVRALDRWPHDNGAPVAGWMHLVDPLYRLAERGWHAEQTWSWLERLRVDDPLIWCAYVDGYGDARAIPHLQAMLDAHAAAFDHLDAFDRNGPDGMIIEAVAALQSLPEGMRPVDHERAAKVDAWRNRLAAPSP